MQSLEAMICLMFFVWCASLAFLSCDPPEPDDSLYRLQLAEDFWRVLYLRNNFRDFGSRDSFEDDMQLIKAQSGLCIFMDGIDYTNCRGGMPHSITASIERTVIINGLPRSFTFSVGTSSDV